jgi:hypothetical protein
MKQREGKPRPYPQETFGFNNRVLDLLNLFMSTIQANFADHATAETARTKLVAAGVSANRIHIWNNITGDAPFAANRDDAAEGGALLGGALGGVAGLAAGAAIGSTYEGSAPATSSAGVRLVVDVQDGDPDVAALLRENGATV